MTSTDKKVLLITGGNTGIGFETVKALYASPHSYELIIGSRSIPNGEAAISTLQSSNANSPSTLSVIQVDLSSDDSIASAIESIASKYGHLDILINNGGASFDVPLIQGKLTVREAFNKTWDVNVAGTQVLTTAAIPLLLKSSDPRLLFLTSGTSSLIETERFDNPALQRINASPPAGWPKDHAGNPITAYRSSKCGLNMLQREWARILKEDGVKVWAISPGFLATGLGGVGAETLRKMGAGDPSIGGNFIKDVVESKRDADVGKVIRKDSIQPW